MHNLPAEANTAHPEKEESDPRAGEEPCTTTLRRSRAGQTSEHWYEKRWRSLFSKKKNFNRNLTEKFHSRSRPRLKIWSGTRSSCRGSPLLPGVVQTTPIPFLHPPSQIHPRTRKPCRFLRKPCRSGGIPGMLRGFPGSTGTGKLHDTCRGFGCWNSAVPWFQFQTWKLQPGSRNRAGFPENHAGPASEQGNPGP